MIKRFILKIILFVLLILLLGSLALLFIGSFCDDFGDNSKVSDFCDNIQSNLNDDVLQIFTIIGSVSLSTISLAIVIIIIFLCCC